MGKLETMQKITLKILVGVFVTVFFFAQTETFAQKQPDLERIFASYKDKKGETPDYLDTRNNGV